MDNIINLLQTNNWNLIKNNINEDFIEWDYLIDQVNGLIHYLTYLNKTEIIKSIKRETIKILLNLPNTEGDTILHISAKLKNYDLLKYLLTLDINSIYQKNKLNNSVIYYIIAEPDIINFIIKNYTIKDHNLNNDYTLLDYYILFNNYDMFIFIIDNIILNHNSSQSIFTVIQSDCNTKDKKKYLNKMIQKRLNINYLYNNISPLILAIHSNDYNLVNFLLKKNADLHYSGIDNSVNPLIMSINTGNSKLVKLLIYYGAKINIYDKNFKTPTHHIIYNNKYFSTKLIKYFIMNSKNINKPDKYGNTVLNLIIQLLDWKLFTNVLVKKKLDIHFKNKMGTSPIDNILKNEYNLFLETVLKSYINFLKHDYDWVENLDKKIHDEIKQNNNIDKYKEKLLKKIIQKNSFPVHKQKNIIRYLVPPKTNITNYSSYTYNYICFLYYLLKKYPSISIPKLPINNIKPKSLYNNLSKKYPYKNFRSVFQDYINHSPSLINHVIIWKNSKIHYIPDFLIEGINLCKQSKTTKYIIIKLTILNEKFNHANMLIYDIDNNLIERFDPYGNIMYPQSFKIDVHLKKYFKENMPGVKYISPKKSAKTISFQIYSDELNEENYVEKDPNGFFVAWCIWYIETRLHNTKIDPKELIQKMEYLINKHNYKFKDYIRDYSNYLDVEKNKILEKYLIPKEYWYSRHIPTEIYKKYLAHMKKFFKNKNNLNDS
ncbi:ankyrin repeat protein [Acanthamoeba polyphaga moumouvirus]|uniref:Ankyrin repeat protein n=1 Tax=Acanthamoeba polyphaga moumouvirus TaxID=1269028 RepID=L7RCM9_9VIRU|nr:ankyrin repeat protein [Acanthamoeba polyphaga moumouvirus]AGC02047.1 ankyrin repeat protein [Acanthamoeba polyphaga moumouvirus]